MRYGCIGSRTFDDYELLSSVLDRHFISIIYSGGAKGADRLSVRYAKEKCIPFQEFIPEWDKYPVTAGFIRNKKIVQSSDIIIAFWDGISRGTKDSIVYANKTKKKVIIISF